MIFQYISLEDPNKIVTILSIAVVTLLLLLAMNIYKVKKLKAKLKSVAKIK